MTHRNPSAAASRWDRSRAAMLAIFSLLTLSTTLLLARQSWAIVLYRLIVDGLVVALWLGAGAGWGAAILWRWRDSEPIATKRVTPLLRAVTRIAMGLGVMSLAVLGLGLLGWLTHITAIALLGGGWIVLSAALYRVRSKLSRDAWSQWFIASARFDWLWLAAAPTLGAALVAAIAPPGILWKADDPHPYDVVGYHLQVPREWFEVGRIIPLHHNVYSYFPFNVESHYLLAMHLYGDPWSAAYACQLMHLAMVVLSVAAVFALLRPREGNAAASVAGVLAATAPWLAQLGSVAYDEGGLLLFGVLAIGWLARAINQSRPHLAHAVIGGAFAGLACGSKLTAVPEVLVAGVVFALVLLVRPGADGASWARRFATVGLFGLLGCATFSPWLIRNFCWAHNPIFPEAATLIGPGHFTPQQVERWNVAHAPSEKDRPLRVRLAAARSRVVLSWQYGYALFPLAPVSLLLAWRRRSTWFFAGLLAALCLIWLFATHLQGRFFVLGIPLAALLLGQVRWLRYGRWAAGVAALIALFNGIALIRELNRYLLAGNDSVLRLGLAESGLLGMDRFSPAQELLENLPPDATLVLVGEARAYLFPLPMSRLRYRTPFDLVATEGEDEIRAWVGSTALPAGSRLLIDPAELMRMNETYRHIPGPDPQLLRHGPDGGRTGALFLADPQVIGQ